MRAPSRGGFKTTAPSGNPPRGPHARGDHLMCRKSRSARKSTHGLTGCVHGVSGSQGPGWDGLSWARGGLEMAHGGRSYCRRQRPPCPRRCSPRGAPVGGAPNSPAVGGTALPAATGQPLPAAPTDATVSARMGSACWQGRERGVAPRALAHLLQQARGGEVHRAYPRLRHPETATRWDHTR